VPARACELRGPGGRWALAAPARLDVSPEPLAAFARARGLPGRALLDLLAAHLPTGAAGPEERRRRDFVAGFLLAAAEPDGFVEILGAPECGGLVAQGWSVSLDAGSVGLARPDGGRDGDGGLATGEAATFARDDILPPGRGVCIFGHDWTADLGALGAVVFEQGGPLRRLDVVEAAVLRLEGADATRHVAHMLPRLAGPTGTLRAFRRVCRPRYPATTPCRAPPCPWPPPSMAVFQAPDGGLLAMGWLLDPLHRVERVHVKSTAHLYAPLQDRWHRLPRPDLAAGFATDPRFARLLDSGDALHASWPTRRGASIRWRAPRPTWNWCSTTAPACSARSRDAARGP
jgi:hypothetical protein